MLAVFTPAYMSRYRGDRAANERLQETLAATVEEIGADDIILTNISEQKRTPGCGLELIRKQVPEALLDSGNGRNPIIAFIRRSPVDGSGSGQHPWNDTGCDSGVECNQAFLCIEIYLSCLCGGLGHLKALDIFILHIPGKICKVFLH